MEGKNSKNGAKTTREDQIIAVVVPIWTKTSMFALPDRSAFQAPMECLPAKIYTIEDRINAMKSRKSISEIWPIISYEHC